MTFLGFIWELRWQGKAVPLYLETQVNHRVTAKTCWPREGRSCCSHPWTGTPKQHFDEWLKTEWNLGWQWEIPLVVFDSPRLHTNLMSFTSRYPARFSQEPSKVPCSFGRWRRKVFIGKRPRTFSTTKAHFLGAKSSAELPAMWEKDIYPPPSSLSYPKDSNAYVTLWSSQTRHREPLKTET